MLSSLKNFLLDLLFPIACIACKKEGTILCDSCSSSLPQTPPCCIACRIITPGDTIHPPGTTCKSCRRKTYIRVFISPFPYHHPIITHLIYDLKYRRIKTISLPAASLIVSYLRYYQITLPNNAVIIPIPLHSARERVRGFNQALLLADALAHDTSLSVLSGVLIRNTATKPQAKLTMKNRHTNVKNIFFVRDSTAVHKKIIILIDDVKTTGATLNQAAHALKAAGAKEIWAITFAH